MVTFLVENNSFDPWFNIASEEYLLRKKEENVIMIWRSRPSIVCGKHQNTLAEINLPFVLKHEIPVVRRLSGGGTVFHDPGNINFTFIRNMEKGDLVNFIAQTKPIIEFLEQLGLEAKFEGKNDLRIKGKKISGNAEHVFKNRVLHHGTLLFNADLTQLNEAIKSREKYFKSKAIKSIRSTVANIDGFLKTGKSADWMAKQLKQFCRSYFQPVEAYSFSETDIAEIEKLRSKKYQTWQWNFGYSPRYEFTCSISHEGDEITANLETKQSLIQNVSLFSKKENGAIFHDLARSMINIQHHPEAVSSILSEYNFLNFNQLKDKWKVLNLFF